MSSPSPAPAERQRNPRGEGARLKVEILDAAHALVDAGEAVTLRSVARRAGIAAPSIYRHFADVDAVMHAIAEQAFEQLVDVLVVARDASRDAAPRLRAICDAYLAFAEDRPQHYRLMFGGVWDATAALEAHPDDEVQLRDLGMDVYRLLVDGIDACVSDGSSASDDPHRDATALWVALHGLANLRETTRLFPWPPHLERVLVTELARLRPRAAP